MLYYILKSTICFSILYLAYLLLLRNEKHFGLNRLVLVAILLVSVALPTLVYTHSVDVTVTIPAGSTQSPFLVAVDINPIAGLNKESVPTPYPPEPIGIPFDLMSVLFALYLLGVSLKVLHLIIHLATMRLQLLRGSRRAVKDGVPVRVSDCWNQTFSLFNTIVLTECDFRSPNRAMLLNHELAHVRQKHSLDLLLAELFVALHWFNPLVYMYRKTLRGVHEYLADGEVVGTGTDPIAYQQFILQCISNTVSPRVANTFSAKLIKNRFAMMTTSHRPSSRSKYLLLIPALAGLFFLFSFRVQEHIVYEYDQEVVPVATATAIAPTPDVETVVQEPAIAPIPDVETVAPEPFFSPTPLSDREETLVSALYQPSPVLSTKAMALQDSAMLHQRLDRVLDANFERLITLFGSGAKLLFCATHDPHFRFSFQSVEFVLV